MINSNLIDLLAFLQRSEMIRCREAMKIRSTELQIAVSSAENLLNSGKLEEMKFQMKSSILRQLSTNEKIEIYILLRVLSLAEDSRENWWSLMYLDCIEFFTKIGLKQNSRYFYLTNLSDNMFLYEIDTRLYNKKTRTNYFRILNNKINSRKDKETNLFQVLEVLIRSFSCHFIFKNRPKKKVFRKGYNDHGSLGSEFSKTLKQQSQDWSFSEQERLKEKEINDFLEFSLGLNGWI